MSNKPGLEATNPMISGMGTPPRGNAKKRLHMGKKIDSPVSGGSLRDLVAAAGQEVSCLLLFIILCFVSFSGFRIPTRLLSLTHVIFLVVAENRLFVLSVPTANKYLSISQKIS